MLATYFFLALTTQESKNGLGKDEVAPQIHHFVGQIEAVASIEYQCSAPFAS